MPTVENDNLTCELPNEGTILTSFSFSLRYSNNFEQK